jgi:flagellar basal-body rod protein FlgB
MTTKGIFDTTIQFLDKILELRIQKHQSISSNIANAETPGYARLRMEFEDQLRQLVIGTEEGQAVTHPGHMPNPSAQQIESFHANFYREKDHSGIGDRNNVSLDQEMVDLSVNQIRFEATILSLNKKFSMLKHVIQERM